ncbi:hypothetical protein IAU60_003330 [Kwoniella sp. DSM 27419]
MYGLKKKLTSLLPSEARNPLQNMLTVEWEGQSNKTVLVDLSDDRNADTEVEMSGLTSSAAGSGYGRLADDDDDQNYDYGRPAPGRSHSSHSTSGKNYSSKSLPPLPSRQTHSTRERDHQINHYTSTSSSSYNGYSSGQPGYRVDNPFEPEYESPQPSSSSTYSGPSPYATFTPQFGHQSAFAQPSDQYGTHSRRAMPNPWAKYRADDVDLLGEGPSSAERNVTSPTSSRGTRDSVNSSAFGVNDDNRNPFA